MSKIKYKTKKRKINLKRGGGLKREEDRIFKEYMNCRHKKGPSVFRKYKPIRSKKINFKELQKLNDKKFREFKKTHKK